VTDHLYIVLQIKSTKLSNEKITSLIGFAPELCQNIGEIVPHINKPRKYNSWYYSTKAVSGIDVNKHWEHLNAKLPKQSKIKDIIVDNKVELFIRGTFETISPIVEVSNRTLSQISGYGFSLGYDIYDLTE